MKIFLTFRFWLLSCFLGLIFLSNPVRASHLVGGELTFHADTTNISPLRYFFKLVLYQDFGNSNADNPTATLNFGDGTTGVVDRNSRTILAANKNIYRSVYYFQHDYSTSGNFIVSFTDLNRGTAFLNVTGSENIPFFIQATVIIGLQAAANPSPVFLAPFILSTTIGQPFRHNVTAYDPDGDSLAYKLVPILQDGGQAVASYQFPESTTINNRTGEILWQQPDKLGRYAYAVEIREYRQGQLIGKVMRDFIVTTLAAATNPSLQIRNRRELPLNDQNQLFITNTNVPLKIRVVANNAVSLDAYSELFRRSNIITAFPTADSPPEIEYTIRPEAILRRSLPYIVTFRGTGATTATGTPQQDLTLAIYFRPERATDQEDTTEPGEQPPPVEPEPDNDTEPWVFKMYPNPVHAYFKVDNNTNSPAKLLLYNASSQLVLMMPLNLQQTTIRRSRYLKPGIYFYVILSEQDKIEQTGKLVFL
ncbi:T9SS type A sorting domain-containing protein [Adhaeribacter rhizoryzae]|uniref:T9SS type A sorting domain-containing protein n=1 Tax=Adhaeribacter rhizoryzae TaxID=2607907 RepID=A0A5M6DTG7_9BACT|nr:T9SS type A sorting domain-containing protein [Adhaeribacter rhizoryzae]KAA5549569.1 T9SS type A sorting domain-containing protein [Adhaeribacter rhizoryzae]